MEDGVDDDDEIGGWDRGGARGLCTLEPGEVRGERGGSGESTLAIEEIGLGETSGGTAAGLVPLGEPGGDVT